MDLDDRLEVRVLCAEDLPEVEGGDCNPFVVVRCGAESRQTLVMNGTSKPVWPSLQRMVFTDLAENDLLQLTVSAMHKNLSGGQDVQLGSVVINLNTAMLGPGIELDEWYEFHTGGRVRLEIVYLMDEDVLESLEEDDDEEDEALLRGGKPPNAVAGTVLRARGLGTLSTETRVSVRVGDYKHASNWSKNLIFNSAFRLPASGDDTLMFKLKSRRLLADALVGMAEVPIVEVAAAGSSMTKWCRLLGPDNTLDTSIDRGQVEVTLAWVYDKKFDRIAKRSKRTDPKGRKGELALLEAYEEAAQASLGGRVMALSTKEREEAEASRAARLLMAERAYEQRSSAQRMRAGAYQIQVEIIEARDLKAEDFGGTSDPYCRVKILGKTKKTRVVRKVTSCVFNETLYFNFDALSSAQIDTATIEIKVMDFDAFTAHDLIGTVTLDIARIFMLPNHELYRQWLHFDTGSIKVSVTVLGEGDAQRPHDVEREYQAEMLKDESAGGDGVVLSTRAEGGVQPPTLQMKFLVVSVWTLEDLDIKPQNRRRISLFGSSGRGARLAARFNGVEAETISSSFGDASVPEELWIPVHEPAESRLVTVSVRDNARALIATVTLDYGELPRRARWYYLYGSPPRRRQAHAAFIENRYGDEASTCHGRLLLSARIESSPSRKEPTIPHARRIQIEPRRPAAATYVFKAFAITSSELPEFRSPGARQAAKMRLAITIGPYRVQTDAKPNDRGVVDWNEILQLPSLPDLPVIVDEMPDVCVYLEQERGSSFFLVSYTRIPAARLLKERQDKNEPFWERLRREPAAAAYPTSVNPGSVLLQLGLALQDEAGELLSSERWDELALRPTDLVPHCLRIYVYQARDLPASDNDALSDAYVKVRFRGQKQKTKVANKTTAPLFYETLQFPNEMLPRDARYGPDIVVQVWDSDTFAPNSPIALLHLPLDHCELLASEFSPLPQPKWLQLSDVNGEPISASLLLAAALFRKRELDEKLERSPDITPSMRPAFLEVTFVGVRQLKGYYGPTLRAPRSPYVRADVCAPNDGDASFRTKPGTRMDGDGRNANFCERKLVQVEMPDNPLFAQRLDIRVFDVGLGKSGLLGACTVDLAPKMPWNRDGFVPPRREVFDDADARRQRELAEAEALRRKNQEDKSQDTDSQDLHVHKNDDTDESGARVDDFHGAAEDWDGGDASNEDDEDYYSEGAMERQEYELERREKPPRGRSSRDDGAGAFDPMILDNLPPILEDVIFEREEEERLKLTQAAADQDDRQHQASFLDALQARFQYATDLDAVLLGETSYKLSELGIEFPTQWATADYIKGRDWWIRTGEEDADFSSLELEKYLKTKPFETYALYRGRNDPNPAKSTLRQVGVLKAIVRVLEENPDLYEVEPFLPRDVLKPQQYVVRLYVIRGRNLQPVDGNSCDPYLRVKLGATQVEDRASKHKTRTLKPDFYDTFEFFTTLPGPSVLKIQVKDWNRFYPVHELVGETKIDLEDRWFHYEWQNLDEPDAAYPANKLKPIEIRSLRTADSSVVQGQLHLWVEIRPAAEAREPRVALDAPPTKDFEVRIICWRTKDVPLDMGDYYCQFWIGHSRKQSTDIHWRCQNGRASWNWRIKVPIQLPLDAPENGRLTVQLWDQDILKWNDVVGEAQLDLYKWFLKAYHLGRSVQVFKDINDAVKRKRNLEMGVALDEDLEAEDEEEDDEEDDDADEEYDHENGEGEMKVDDEEAAMENDQIEGPSTDLEEGGVPMEGEEAPTKKGRRRKVSDEKDLEERPSKAEMDEKDAAFFVKQLKDAVGLGDIDDTAQWIRMTYHNREKRKIYSRGSVALSIEILPKEEAELRPAGFGISAPNQHPVLPPRTGRLSFTLNPLALLSALCGPRLATMICCTLCCALFLFIWFYVGLYFENFYTMYQAFENL